MGVNSFDVMKAMSAKNRDIRLAPLDNVSNLRKTKAGTLVTIGVEGDVVAAIGIEHRFVGGLILADRAQFTATKDELAAAEDPSAGLLAALEEIRKGLLENIEEDGGSGGPDPQPPEPATKRDWALAQLVQVANAAIAKAKGRP